MAKESLDHRRTHNLLLISRLLNQRENVSPFTLILDSLSQSSRPLLNEYIERATAAKYKTIFVSFEAFTPPKNITLITARRKPVARLQEEIAAAAEPAGSRILLILDSLNHVSSSKPKSLAPFLSSLLSPTTTLLGVYHTDVPICLPAEASADAYPDSAPEPLTLLKYFCTTLIVMHSITHVLAEKQNRDKALPAPVWGLGEGIEGLLVGFGSNSPKGVVLEMEYRRKSGRGVVEWYYLPLEEAEAGKVPKSKLPGGATEKVILLEDHPEWRLSEIVNVGGHGESDEEPQSTFDLSLTESQRKARDQVVLPYFDAQREGGIGGGGAILFTPDREIDDFDDEEDEI